MLGDLFLDLRVYLLLVRITSSKVFLGLLCKVVNVLNLMLYLKK